MEHLVKLFPVKFDDLHLSDITEHGLFCNQRQMSQDVRNHKMPQGYSLEACLDKLMSICGHCLPSSSMMPPAVLIVPSCSKRQSSLLCHVNRMYLYFLLVAPVIKFCVFLLRPHPDTQAAPIYSILRFLNDSIFDILSWITLC